MSIEPRNERDRLRRGVGMALALGLGLAAPVANAIPPGSGVRCHSEGIAVAQGGVPGEQRWSGGCSALAEARGEVYVLVDAGTTNVHTFKQAALAVGNGSAGLGTLHAYSRTRASSDPMQYIWVDSADNTRVTPNNYTARAESSVDAWWYDEFQVQWPVFSMVPVAVRITVALSGGASSSPSPVHAGIHAAL